MARRRYTKGDDKAGASLPTRRPDVFDFANYRSASFAATTKLMRSGGNGPNDGISVANFRAGAVMKNVRGGRGVFNARVERPETKLYDTPTGSRGANVETRKGYGVQLDRATAMLETGKVVTGKVTRKQRLAKR